MKLLGVILLLLLGVLLFLLLWPVTIRFSVAGGQAEVSLRYLFLKKQLYPRPEREEKPAKPKKKKKKKEPAEGEKEKTDRFAALRSLSVSDWLEIGPELVKKCLRPVRALLRRTTLARFSLSVLVSGGDAQATAVAFGRWQAAVCNAVAVLDRIIRLRAQRIDIAPDFCGEKTQFETSGEVRLCPLAVLIAVLNLAVIALCAYLRIRKISKQKAKAC